MPPIDPAFLRSLADGGGLVLLFAFIIAAAITLFRGSWVPGWIHKQVLRERDDALNELKTSRRTNDRLTVQLDRERRRRSSDFGERRAGDREAP
jgi:hypothetical protein